eukprot:8779934-Ditylum_brightwellii.AAC.1
MAASHLSDMTGVHHGIKLPKTHINRSKAIDFLSTTEGSSCIKSIPRTTNCGQSPSAQIGSTREHHHGPGGGPPPAG